MESIVTDLFNLGLGQLEIRCVLAEKFDYTISQRQLRRVLSRLGLFRRKNFTRLDDIIDFIQRELTASGQLHGYRFMHLKCITNGLVVSRETVRIILRELDPDGVELRKTGRLVRRRYSVNGPNYMWHVDSYDKLKPYGICINGCIDGFSRYIIWLEAHFTNSNPAVIGGYFMKTVETRNGCPKLIRADLGTENGHIEHMQTFLREGHQEERCFQYGRSTANQRIESWWGILRKENAEFWMALFNELQGQGHFSGEEKDKELIRFCFMLMIQNELDEVSQLWNVHRIRKYNNAYLNHGRPFMMYSVPAVYGSEDYLCAVDADKVDICMEHCNFKSDCPCADKDMYDLCCMLMDEHGLDMPSNPEEGRDLYLTLRRIVNEHLD